MKGIILAGGTGSRLFPLTVAVSKQLLPIYDKPMVYYPLSTLMLAGIRDVLVISTPGDLPRYELLLGDGTDLGMRFSYIVQEKPEGLAQAFLLGEEFIGDDSVCLVLGDNIFYGHGLTGLLNSSVRTVEEEGKTVIFGYYVTDPERYGVAEFDRAGNVLSIEEKPSNPRSNYAVVGLYFYDNSVIRIARNLRPSARGELEITDVNGRYLEMNRLKMELMGRGYAWLDTGTDDSLLQASNFVQTIEQRQGLKIACIEEIAFNQGFIERKQLLKLAEKLRATRYGSYLRSVAERESRWQTT